jgi:energy-coupling factor transport system substrate-specific component
MMQERRSILFYMLLVTGSLAVNTGLAVINEELSLPFFLDSIGTAVAAASGGLISGLIVAVGTNLLQEVVFGFTGQSWPFFICGVATVLIVRAFVRAHRFESVGDILLVTLLVALANAVLGGTIATFVYGGLTSVGLDYLVTGLVSAGRTLLSAAFLARIPANLVDKAIAVFTAYYLLEPLRDLHRRMANPVRKLESVK